jgi:hypothetical protein
MLYTDKLVENIVKDLVRDLVEDLSKTLLHVRPVLANQMI